MTLPSGPTHKVALPTPLRFKRSPNQSQRLHNIKPYLIVVHRPVGEYGPSIEWLCNPRAQASAHVITEGNNTGADVATQLVEWDHKAWACASFNSASYNLEVDDDAWNGDDLGAAFTAARIVGFLCRRTGIPPSWTKKPLTQPGVTRHHDLGRAGGGHSDPTTDTSYWRWFVRQCRREWERGGYRRSWGRGQLVRI